MKHFTAYKLTHTLQTYLGMVMNNGEPRVRLDPCIPNYLIDTEEIQVSAKHPSSLSEEALVALFTSCVLDCRLPQFRNPNDPDVKRLKANIYACCDTQIDIAFMKSNIGSLLRLDLEQAAAVVISAIRNDDGIANRSEIVQSLLKEIHPKVLSHSCMWFEYAHMDSAITIQARKFSHIVTQTRHIIQDKHMVEMGECPDWQCLLPLLLRIRRCSPRSRCLFIPEWIFREANATPPSEFCVWDKRGRVAAGHEPILAPASDSIVLTRKEFRRVQRRLLRYFRFWDPTLCLRQDIKNLEANVIYGTELIRSQVLPSNDTLVVAHYFFALQRRMQRKVVSDLQWTSFLQKGESGNIVQNNPEIPTTFEERLSTLSGQSGVPLSGSLLPQIDQCCLLMESYVKVYGNGDRKNLVFVRGVSGGSGRGAVDDYNLLCDILNTLCGKAKEEGVKMPGPVRKFLAKDIMAWNEAFGDDAFAGGRVPGWEPWLAERREMGILQGIEALSIE
ncbi:hypothetical protein HO173_009274 [Letharia columbiana]|uniref:Uncharacterized protein n=1 Tax=Letharia columbiana TaxID=112416 RepID=A0A8H6FQ29_9LECA|nr:uncharacterized protein HO173_009274 [Letharia columbiana]KAF6232606.1 hypothetical protein HO173_009274 [Letharia columbiana]